MRRMSRAEARELLARGTRTAKLATVGEDGAPHVTPVWFALDDDGTLVFTTGATTAKGANLARDPRASLCVDDETPPFAFVRVDGTVTLEDDAPDLLRWTTLIARRYMGEARADEYGRRNAVPGELLARLTPTRIVARAGVADDGGRGDPPRRSGYMHRTTDVPRHAAGHGGR